MMSGGMASHFIPSYNTVPCRLKSREQWAWAWAWSTGAYMAWPVKATKQWCNVVKLSWRTFELWGGSATYADDWWVSLSADSICHPCCRDALTTATQHWLTLTCQVFSWTSCFVTAHWSWRSMKSPSCPCVDSWRLLFTSGCCGHDTYCMVPIINGMLLFAVDDECAYTIQNLHDTYYIFNCGIHIKALC